MRGENPNKSGLDNTLGESKKKSQEGSCSPSDCTPQVGDVVEFEHGKTTHKGILFYAKGHGTGLCLCKNDGDTVFAYLFDGITYVNPRVIAHTHCLYGEPSITEARKLAKAYFSNPIFTGTYEERQKQWVEYHDLKVGDKARAMRKAEYLEDGWGNSWIAAMDKSVGKTQTIESFGVASHGIHLSDGCGYPYFVLEPVGT